MSVHVSTARRHRPSPLTETYLFVLPLSAVYVSVKYRPNTDAVLPQPYTNGRAVPHRYKLPNRVKRMRLGIRRPLHGQLRSNVCSYSDVHQRIFSHVQRNSRESRISENLPRQKEGEKGAQIPVGYNRWATRLLTRSVQASVKRLSHNTEGR
jgi:hypothetical protein